MFFSYKNLVMKMPFLLSFLFSASLVFGLQSSFCSDTLPDQGKPDSEELLTDEMFEDKEKLCS